MTRLAEALTQFLAASAPRRSVLFEKSRRFAKEALLQVRPGVFWWYVRVRHGHLEPEMALLPRLCLPDQVSVDVGANYGIYSYYMLKYSKECVAFEPYPHLAELLRKGLAPRLQVHQLALSDHPGAMQMRASPAQTGINTIEPSNRIEFKALDPKSIVTLEVSVRRLDEFELGPVGFIKIDVEGHEQEVIAGSKGTIAKYRPALLIEVLEQHRAGARTALQAQLGELGYRAFFVQHGKLRPAEAFDVDRHQNDPRADEYVKNFVFLPQHRLKDFAAEMSSQ